VATGRLKRLFYNTRPETCACRLFDLSQREESIEDGFAFVTLPIGRGALNPSPSRFPIRRGFLLPDVCLSSVETFGTASSRASVRAAPRPSECGKAPIPPRVGAGPSLKPVGWFDNASG
jgi:hypothetical protein